jgi:serine/threonine-protein kinase RsbW
VNSLDISLRNDPAELSRLADLLKKFGRQHGLSPAALLATDLALHEHLTNIIQYGYDDASPREIRIRLSLKERLLRVEVEDDARPFNPMERPPVDTTVPLDHKPIGGLGVHIIRKSMDELAYRRAGDKNLLLMIKRLD